MLIIFLNEKGKADFASDCIPPNLERLMTELGSEMDGVELAECSDFNLDVRH